MVSPSRRRSLRRAAPAVALAVAMVLAGVAIVAPTAGAVGVAEPPVPGSSPSNVAPTDGREPVLTPGTTPSFAVSRSTTPTTSDTRAGDRDRVENETLACQPDPDRPDPPTDQLGWESGCWHDESLEIDTGDGLNETEIERLSARTMARIEAIRGLEFTDPVTVDVVSRSELDGGTNRTIPFSRRVRANLRYEALLMVGEDEDVLGGGGGGGGRSFAAFYAPWDDRVVIIIEGETTDRVHEPILAHELVHALQDQHFEGERRSFWDQRRAKRALVEGEAAFVVQTLRERCAGEWAGTCLLPEEEERQPDASRADRWCGQTDPGFNWGRHLVNIFPYSDGPVLVEQLYESGGWAAVSAAHEDPPDSTSAVIHPERYGEPSVNVTLADRSGPGWTVVEPPRQRNPTRLSMGESAVFAMLWYQWFETDHRAEVIPCAHAFETDNPRTKFNYSHPVSDGLVGDRLLPYNRTGTADRNETGYVWKTVWASPADAREFADAYRTVLRGHNGTAVDGRPNTYVLPENSTYADAFYVERRGDVVLVVNAPSVEALEAIRPDIETASTTPTPPATGTPTRTPEATPTPQAAAGGGRSGVPGFGLGLALGALAAVGAALLWRRRDQ